jgi:hypothetical protein
MLRKRTALTLTAVLLAVGAPVAQAGQDLRSPDARDAAGRPPERVYSYYTTDANHIQDLRSPDARDLAHPVQVPPASLRPVRVVEPGGSGFDWADAAIGAAMSFGLVLLVAGGITVVGRRNRLRTT